MSKNKSIEKLRRQSVKAVMDLLLLAELRNSNMSGYDAISFIHNKFGVLLSSGTVYSHLYALERDGLITGNFDVKKRVYQITEKGEQILGKAYESNIELISMLNEVLNT